MQLLVPHSLAPGDFDRLVSGHGLTLAALSGHPPTVPPISTALYRDTALLWPPYQGTPLLYYRFRPPCTGTRPYSGRLIGAPPYCTTYHSVCVRHLPRDKKPISSYWFQFRLDFLFEKGFVYGTVLSVRKEGRYRLRDRREVDTSCISFRLHFFTYLRKGYAPGTNFTILTAVGTFILLPPYFLALKFLRGSFFM